MNTLLILIFRVLDILLTAFQYLMLARAVLSWIPGLRDNAIYAFIYDITEPVIFPVRTFLDKLGFSDMMPIDLSFLLTYILLILIRGFLPYV